MSFRSVSGDANDPALRFGTGQSIHQWCCTGAGSRRSDRLLPAGLAMPDDRLEHLQRWLVGPVWCGWTGFDELGCLPLFTSGFGL